MKDVCRNGKIRIGGWDVMADCPKCAKLKKANDTWMKLLKEAKAQEEKQDREISELRRVNLELGNSLLMANHEIEQLHFMLVEEHNQAEKFAKECKELKAELAKSDGIEWNADAKKQLPK